MAAAAAALSGPIRQRGRTESRPPLLLPCRLASPSNPADDAVMLRCPRYDALLHAPRIYGGPRCISREAPSRRGLRREEAASTLSSPPRATENK
jgi:hypothetical protein